MKFSITKRIPSFNHNVWYGLTLGTIALVFFVRGLDEDNDYLRINHGLWHFFVGLAIYFVYHSKQKGKLP
jgi:predicted membrane channel-forming protein YqfA (hemolysin III family)